MTVNHEQAPLPFVERDIPSLDRFARIETLSMVEDGFYPVTKPEQVEAMALHSVIDKTSGTSRHLAEVIKNQNRNRVTEPERAVRSIVRSYTDWALDAKATKSQLEELYEQIKDINPTLSMDAQGLENDLSQIGLLKFLRFFDLNTLNEKGRIKDVGYDPQKVKYDEENDGIKFYLDEGKAIWTVRQVKLKLPVAIEDSTNRLSFWTQRNVEVTMHSHKNLAAIANDGLDKILDRQKVQ